MCVLRCVQWHLLWLACELFVQSFVSNHRHYCKLMQGLGASRKMAFLHALIRDSQTGLAWHVCMQCMYCINTLYSTEMNGAGCVPCMLCSGCYTQCMALMYTFSSCIPKKNKTKHKNDICLDKSNHVVSFMWYLNSHFNMALSVFQIGRGF